MIDSSPIDEDIQIGYVGKFDVGTNIGVIIDADGKIYDFSGQDIVGQFPVLMERPWVSFNIVDGAATEIMYDPRISERKVRPRRGLSIFGAAKCPKCDWRIPALPAAAQAGLRRKDRWAACPECDASLVLKSSIKGYHNFLAVAIWIILIVGTRILLVEFTYFAAELGVVIWLIGVVFYMIMFLALFYVYFQERLVCVEVPREQ